MVIKYIILVIAVWLCIVFIIPLLIFPGFLRKRRVRVTEKTRRIARRLRSKNKEKTLRNVFNYVKKMYTSEKYNLFLQPYKHFYILIDRFVDKKQFLPCHVQSLVLITLLLATGQFKPEDLKKKIVITEWLTIHQYYIIKAGKKTFKADAWEEALEEWK